MHLGWGRWMHLAFGDVDFGSCLRGLPCCDQKGSVSIMLYICGLWTGMPNKRNTIAPQSPLLCGDQHTLLCTYDLPLFKQSHVSFRPVGPASGGQALSDNVIHAG